MGSATNEPPRFACTVRPALPVDLALTLGPLTRGPGDPTAGFGADGAFWRATRTPLGVATTRFTSAGGAVRVEAWGPGAEWVIAAAPDVLGARDSLAGFAPTGRLAELHRRAPGLRFGRTRAVYEAAIVAVCEQQVTGIESRRALRALARRFGEPAPCGLLTPPLAERIARVPAFELWPHGIPPRRTGTLHAVARAAARLDAAIDVPTDRARALLESLPGIGVWTSAHVAACALGDPDAVLVGDDHVPHVVAFAFTGAPRGTDAQMLELLAPYAGHRGRVIRLIMAAGIAEPRFGPRRRLRPSPRT